MTIKKQVADYFAGITTLPISKEEQTAHNLLVRKVRHNTTLMLRREAIKIRRQYEN